MLPTKTTEEEMNTEEEQGGSTNAARHGTQVRNDANSSSPNEKTIQYELRE
jgi:hypothetical protein